MFKVSPGIASITTALLVGGGCYAAYEVLGMPRVVETPAQVEACARRLGSTAITSDELPGDCKNVPGLFERTETHPPLGESIISYRLPSGDEFRTRSKEVISEHEEQRRRDDNFRNGAFPIAGVIAGVTMYIVDSRDQKRQRIRKIEARIR